jgi:electron transfer flavoprotein alpha subunit
MKILVCTETRSGQLDSVSLEMLSAARSVARSDDEIVALVVGEAIEPAAARIGSADRAVAAIDGTLDLPTAEAYARIALEVVEAEAPDLVLVAYSSVGLDVAPDLALRCGLPLVSYVVSLTRAESRLSAVSQLYGGKVLASVDVDGRAVLMINPGAFPEAPAGAIDARAIIIHDPSASLRGLKIELLEEVLPDLADVDLAVAERIVCVGRGIGDESGIELVRPLAALLKADIAGSRPVVDNGWLPKIRQVGKSGRKVKPKLYLALGVSGAPEHLEGMSRSDLIIAVNIDPKAPIFGVAHYGATCDLFDLIGALTERLQTEQAQC